MTTRLIRGMPTGVPVAALFSLGLLLSGASSARGTVLPEPDGGERVLRCAVVVADDGAGAGLAPLAELLQAELSGRAGLVLVERGEVERVLREQQLGEAFAAGQTAKRAVLGRLLRADLLVLLRAGEAPLVATAGQGDGGGGAPGAPPLEARGKRLHAWVTVCETRQGIRLGTSAVPLTPDVRADAVAAAARVDAAVARMRARARAVVAVPSFVSRDLTHESDYLKAACARLVEQALLRREDVVVVELDEARALADEAALADGDAVRRSGPVYLLGAYRTERPTAADGAARVTVSLSLRRGEHELATASTGAVPIDGLAAALAAALGDLDDHFAAAAGPGDAVPAPDPDSEARVLAARAREFFVVGDWAEAAGLYEAALLLDPAQPDARLELGLSLVRTPLTRDERLALEGTALRRADAFPEDRVRETAIIERLIAGFERRLGHLEIYLRAGERADLGRTIWEFTWPPFEIGGPDRGHEALAPFNARIQGAQRESFLRVIRSRAAPGAPRDNVVGALLSSVPWRVGRETTEDALRLMIAVFREIAHLPDASHYATMLVAKASHAQAFGVEPKAGTTEHDAFVAARQAILLDPLLNWPDERIPAAIRRDERLHREMAARVKREREAAMLAARPAAPADAGAAAEAVVFRRFEPKLVTPDGEPLSLGANDFFRWKPAGDSVDVVWTRAGVWLVRQPGRAEPAVEPVNGSGPPSSVSYDGRYLWVALHGDGEGQPPVLLARDIRPGGRTWRVTPEHALPLPEPALPSFDLQARVPPHVLTVAGVSPGRACVAGSFGRTWFAMVTLDPAAGPKAEVFHEAREVPPRGSTDEGWSNPSVAFQPEAMFVIRGDDGDGGDGGGDALPAPTRVVVTGHGDRPLLLDPDRRTASVMDGSLFPHPLSPNDTSAAFAEQGGALYVITLPSYKRFGDYTGQPGGAYLYRIGFPALEPVPVMTGVPQGHLRFDRGRALVVGRGVWLLELDAKRSWPQATRMPWLHVNHFWDPDDPVASIYPNPIPQDVLLLSNVFTSNHYGLLAHASDRMGNYIAFRAEFADEPGR